MNGWSGSPAILVARPPSTVTSVEHASGQSCGQPPRTTWVSLSARVTALTAGDVRGNRTAIEARSKRYRAGRRRATPSGAAPNTFDVMDLHPTPRGRERCYSWDTSRDQSRGASSPAGRTLHTGRASEETHCCPCTWTTFPVLTLAIETVDSAPDPGTACADHGNVDHPPQGERR